jgi:O-acetyl-ADP-ribose deacetylase (regulator of RNase III)
LIAVGPIWQGGKQNEPYLLEAAVLNALNRADEYQLKSIAIPAISSGIYGFPKPLCAKIMLDTILKYIHDRDSENRPATLQRIRLVNFDEPTVSVFTDEFDKRKRAGKLL